MIFIILKASRKDKILLTAAAGTAYSQQIYAVSSNRTFILTGLHFSTSESGEGLTIYDGASATTPTASTAKLEIYGNPYTMSDLDVEFSTGISASLIGERALPVRSVTIWGYER